MKWVMVKVFVHNTRMCVCNTGCSRCYDRVDFLSLCIFLSLANNLHAGLRAFVIIIVKYYTDGIRYVRSITATRNDYRLIRQVIEFVIYGTISCLERRSVER